jgi:hypothetical protein
LKRFGSDGVNTTLGWYKYEYENGILEVTVVKDPILTISYITEVPITAPTSTPTSTTTTTYHSSGGGGGGSISSVGETYSDVAQDIKSVKIKEVVHKYKLIIGSETDNNLSTKYLKNESELINKPLEIKEDCILVGGPVANPLVKKTHGPLK